MAITLTSTKQLAALHGVKIIVYGRAGVGKTMLTATAPAPLLITAESGVLSMAEENIIRTFGENQPNISYDIPAIEIKTVEDLLEAYRFVTESEEMKAFQTVCLDSISEIGETVLQNAKKLVKDPRQAYGELIDRMTEVIKKFRDLSGKHVYFSAKQAANKDDQSGMTLFGPDMPGRQLPQAMPYLPDELFNLNVATYQQEDGSVSNYRYLRTQPDVQYDAKDRSGALAEIEKPDLTHIIHKIMGINNG